MLDRWKKWLELPLGAFVMARPAEKTAFLRAVHAEGRLTSLRFLGTSDLSGSVTETFLPFMKNHFGLGFGHAAKILPLLDYLDPARIWTDPQLAFLTEIRQTLIENGIYRPVDTTNWGDSPIFLLNPIENSGWRGIRPVQTLHTWKTMTGEIPLWECVDPDAQAHAVIDHLSRALAEGRKPESLAVVNASESDKTRLMLEGKLYGFSLTEERQVPLVRFPKMARFVRSLGALPLETMIQRYRETCGEEDRRAFAGLISIVNRYGISVLESDLDLLRYEIGQAHVTLPEDSGAIRMIHSEAVIPDPDCRYHWMNFTDATVPPIQKDIDYLSDKQKQEIGIPTSTQRNDARREETLRLLNAVPDLVLYYPSNQEGRENRIPDLDLSRPIVKNSYILRVEMVSRSRAHDRLLFGKRRHAWLNYGIHPDDYGLLRATHGNPWTEYDPRFNGLRPDQTERFIHRGVTLSPTSLSCFYQCRFRYFLQYLMRISPHETSLELSLGNMTHYVLSQALSTDLSVEQCVNAYLPSDELLSRDETAEWLARRYAERLAKVIALFRERRSHGGFTDFSAESVYSYLHPENPNFKVLGKIDLVRTFRMDQKAFVAVVDYKTGHNVFRDDDFIKGIDIQLVFYLHVLKQTNAIPEMIPAGFYYQPVNLGRIMRNDAKDPYKEKLKMNGITLKSPRIAKEFDPDGDVRGLLIKADGEFHARAKVADFDRMSEYLDQMQGLIDQAIQRIQKGDFAITPLPTRPDQSGSDSCEFCPFQGICYLADSSEPNENPEIAEGDD